VSLRRTTFRVDAFSGVNTTDPPQSVGDDQLTQAFNAELTGTGGVMRGPSARVLLNAPSTSADCCYLARHTPSQNLSASEVWAFARNSTSAYRSTTGTSWTTVTVPQTVSANECVTDTASFNGRLYVAYKNHAGDARLHCWDGTTFRRVGISTSAAPTAANTGTGSYAATVRYYKVQFYYQDGTSKVTYSDLSPALTFTPSGSGTGVVVTRPTAPDSASGWRVWASADNVSFHLIQAGQAIGTTTYTDSAAPSTYAAASVIIAPPADTYTPPWSAKYLLVDDNRLLIAGAFETARYASRIGWSAILGTAAASFGESGLLADDERFPSTQFLDLDSDEGGELTGMELLNGSVYVFKRFAIYKLVRTGNVDVPYKPVTVSKVVGAISRPSIVPGEDETGAPCLYFLSQRGPYRLSVNGLQYLGRDIETTWASYTVQSGVTDPACGVYDRAQGKVRWWVPLTTTYPGAQLVFHVRRARPDGEGLRGGWTMTSTGRKSMAVAHVALLPSNPSARQTGLVPCGLAKFGAHSYPSVVWAYTGSATDTDDGVNVSTGAASGTESFNLVVQTKAYPLVLDQLQGVDDVHVLCRVFAPTYPSVTALLWRDFYEESRQETSTVISTFGRKVHHFAALTLAEARYVTLYLTSTTQCAWGIEGFSLRMRREGPL
jgi:hypothetical protein